MFPFVSANLHVLFFIRSGFSSIKTRNKDNQIDVFNFGYRFQLNEIEVASNLIGHVDFRVSYS